MRDEMFDREYQAARAELNDGIDRAIGALKRTIGDALTAMHRIEWSAPWRQAAPAPKRMRRA